MAWQVKHPNRKYNASEGSTAGWHECVETDASGKKTGNTISVTAPTPDMALEAVQVLAKHFDAQ